MTLARRRTLTVAGVFVLAVTLGLATAQRPLLVVVMAGVATVAAAAGIEWLIASAVLVGSGLAPFIDSQQVVASSVPVWTVAFAAAFVLMAVAWAFRPPDTERSASRMGSPVLLVLVLAYATHVALRIGFGGWRALPTTAFGFVPFAAAAAMTAAWLNHGDVPRVVRRVAPLVVAAGALWAVAYLGAALGACGPCGGYVQVTQVRDFAGLGHNARVYAAGEQAFLVLTIFVLAWAMERRSVVRIGIAGLFVACVAVQGFRVHYLVVLAALAVLLAWHFRVSSPPKRLVLTGAVCGMLVLATLSPVGARAVSGYHDVVSQSGTVGYRIGLVDGTRSEWTALGQGVNGSSFPFGLYYDLGIPNTLIAVGYLGALLQLAVLVTAAFIGLRRGSPVAVACAAVCVGALVGRPSLALLEFGPSSAFYGIAVGVIAAEGSRAASWSQAFVARGHMRRPAAVTR